MTAAELAGLEALVASEKARQNQGAASSPGHDNGIGADDGAPTNGDAMCRAVIFHDRKKWRVRIVDLVTGKATTHSFDSEEEARAAAPKLRRQYQRPVGVAMAEAFAEYRIRLARKGNQPRSIDTTLGRLEDVFGDREGLTGEIVAPVPAIEAWDRYMTTPGRKTKRLAAVSTQSNTLHEVRTFCGWLLSKGWIKAPVLVDVVVEGRRKRRKPQLDRLDDCRKFNKVALELGLAGDAGAVAAVCALLLALRATEISKITVGDLDDQCRIWIVKDAKTRAGDRRVRVPEALRVVLMVLTAGKGPGDRSLVTKRTDSGSGTRSRGCAASRACPLSAPTVFEARIQPSPWTPGPLAWSWRQPSVTRER